MIFLVSLHYQSLQIIVLLLQACLLEILTSFVRCDRGYLTITLMTFSPFAFGTVKEMKWSVLLGSYEDPFAIIGGVCLSASLVSRGLLGGI